MTTNRRPRKHSLRRRLNAEAIAAWHRADYMALHNSLNLMPFEASPLPIEIISLGVSEEIVAECTPPTRPFEESLPAALALQRELLAVSGYPRNARAAFEKNLADAEERVRYAQELVDNPHAGPAHRVGEMADRRAKLERALDEVRYRRQLLDELRD